MKEPSASNHYHLKFKAHEKRVKAIQVINIEEDNIYVLISGSSDGNLKKFYVLRFFEIMGCLRISKKT